MPLTLREGSTIVVADDDVRRVDGRPAPVCTHAAFDFHAP